MRDEFNAQHNLRVGLGTARSSIHELINQLRERQYGLDRQVSATSDKREAAYADDIKWKLYDLQSLAESYQERIEMLQDDVDNLLNKLQEID